MARIAAILKALATAYRRDQKSLESVVGNNFFLVTALLLQKAGIVHLPADRLRPAVSR